jgi:hypothetical protein
MALLTPSATHWLKMIASLSCCPSSGDDFSTWMCCLPKGRTLKLSSGKMPRRYEISPSVKRSVILTMVFSFVTVIAFWAASCATLVILISSDKFVRGE